MTNHLDMTTPRSTDTPTLADLDRAADELLRCPGALAAEVIPPEIADMPDPLRADLVATAKVMTAWQTAQSGLGGPSAHLANRPGQLSFDDLYAYRFGGLDAGQNRRVADILRASPADQAYDDLLCGLPSLEEAQAAADVAAREGVATLPADLADSLAQRLGMPNWGHTPESLLGRLGQAALTQLREMAATATAAIVWFENATIRAVPLADVEAAPREVALAYDGLTPPATLPVPANAAPGDPDSSAQATAALPALSGLPTIRVEHSYLCLALANERPGPIEVALLDLQGQPIATARPNDIGVVLFRHLTPGLYGLRVVSCPTAA